jgi:hypothetical protein
VSDFAEFAKSPGVDMSELTTLCRAQSGTVARQQILALGGQPHDVRRMLRRRDLTTVHRGVFVDHTGKPTWLQRAWAAVLATAAFAEGSVEPTGSGLSHDSSLRIAEGAGRAHDDGPIHVLVDGSRRIATPAGVVVHRSRHFDERMLTMLLPPRTRYEHALLDVASDAQGPMESLALLARAVGDRRTSVQRILAVSHGRARLPRRNWIEAVLADVDAGTCSVLEHGYLARVVKPHALPVPDRQRREVSPIGVVYRDAAYMSVLVELDGRLHHADVARRDADLDRDLFAAVAGSTTVRLGWGQVFRNPCRTAWALGALVPVDPGLPGPRPCGSGCPVGRPLDVEDRGHRVA